MSRIVNGAPMTVLLGIDDQSTRQVTAVGEELPQHLPKVYIYAKKGPTTPQLVVGASRSLMFGEETFDELSKYANHQTVLSNIINAEGNAQMIQRVEPTDANPPASLRLSLDVLPMAVPEYERNTDGSFKLNAQGQKIATGATVPGFKVKWVADAVEVGTDGESTFGKGARKAGNMVDATTSTQSQRYPIKDIVAPYFGEDGNNYGIRFYAPTTQSNTSIDPTLLEDAKVMAYPFRMSCMYKATPQSTPKFVFTQYAEQYVDVCLKSGVINKRTGKQASVEDIFIQSYQDLEHPSNPPMYGPFGDVHVYQNNIEELLDLFYAAEKNLTTTGSDFTGAVGEEYRFNLLSGTTSSGVPYHSYQIEYNEADAVRLSESTTIFARGGSDGTMDNQKFDLLVADAVKEYANPLSPLQDTATYPESIIYDSGFSLDTKYALGSFLSIRKDTAVAVGTYTVGDPMLTPSEDTSLAIALRTRFQMYPESSYFGTPVTRAIIIGRSGKLLSSQTKYRLPLTLELAKKSAKYMGAGDGNWKSGQAFDAHPGSLVTMFGELSSIFTPASVRNKDWDACLNYPLPYSRRSAFFPALKTVYSDDTSVLNSYFTMMACCTLQKIGEQAWRKYSGSSNLTNAQLSEEVVKFVNENVNGKFDGRFVIVPEVYFTEADLQRGYSWGLRIKLYAPNMKTVMTLSVQTYRLDDLAA